MPTLLRNATVIDGTGAPGRPGDVLVEGGRISAVEPPGSFDAAVYRQGAVDLDGLALAPGFIDIHTHYDAQVLWDPDLTSSCWHGVTSVIAGNCGYGVAPTRAEDRETILRTLQSVEGMSYEALKVGVAWSFETFPEYLDALDQLPKRLNVGAFQGHSPLRQYVMGSEATERPATPDEVDEMVRLLGEAMEAGAMGFSSSMSSTHRGAYGKPVPSRLAGNAEIEALAAQVAAAGRGVMQANQGPTYGYEALASLADRLQIPLTWTAALTGLFGSHGALDEAIGRTKALSARAWPQIACHPLVQQMALTEPTLFSKLGSFQEVFELPAGDRSKLYASTAWRDRARPEAEGIWNASGRSLWERMSVQETEQFRSIKDRPLADVALERGTHPFDVMLDVALAEGLATRFRVVLLNDDESELSELLDDERTIVGLSDAGAHASMLCDAGFSTYLLGHWVREMGALTLEQGVRRLSGQIAEVFSLSDRGFVKPGFVADLVAFDPSSFAVRGPERIWDLPGGEDRLIARADGIVHVWVMGHAIVSDGELVRGAWPGEVLRPAQRPVTTHSSAR